MRPAIKDSLISGQPLYLLNSYSKRGPPFLSALLLVWRATQATGSGRLQVTGRPPTCSGAAAAPERDAMADSTAPLAPWSSRRRCGEWNKLIFGRSVRPNIVPELHAWDVAARGGFTPCRPACRGLHVIGMLQAGGRL